MHVQFSRLETNIFITCDFLIHISVFFPSIYYVLKDKKNQGTILKNTLLKWGEKQAKKSKLGLQRVGKV